jgi:arylsulfatase A-like enzyme
VGVRNNHDFLPDPMLPLLTLPQYFQQAGYQTAGFGKTHWVAPDCSSRGFEVRFVGQPRDSLLTEQGAVMMSDENEEALADYFYEVSDGEECIRGYEGYPSEVAGKHHRDGWVTEKCVDFVNGRDDERPLFLYLSLIKPHAAFNVPDGFEQLYNLEDMPADILIPPWEDEEPGHYTWKDSRTQHFRNASPEVRRRMLLYYYANCSWIDSLFGQALDALRSRGLLENSLIVYCSDHGEMLGEHSFRFDKRSHYESSIRVPIVLSGDRLPQSLHGTADERPASLVDLVPTLLDAAGIEAPRELAGESLLQPPVRTGSFAEYRTGTCASPSSFSCMWRRKGAKLILHTLEDATEDAPLSSQANVELYDIENDPHEWNDLSQDPAYQELRHSMLLELTTHLMRSWGRFPAPGKRDSLSSSVPRETMQRYREMGRQRKEAR